MHSSTQQLQLNILLLLLLLLLLGGFFSEQGAWGSKAEMNPARPTP
jgi:hypothetical protein